MAFATPMIWRESKDHLTDSYFYLANIKGITSKRKYTFEYPNLPSAMRTALHSEKLPVPIYGDIILSDNSDYDLSHTEKY